MSQTNRISVPPELTNILLEFTVNVLVERPVDIVNYAVNYFTKLRTERQQNGTKNVEFENDAGASEDDDILDEEPPRPPNRFTRRKSVFAEHYDPEEDEDDDNDKVVYPKSDEQRQQLAESVRNILLFRSLDQEQVQEVLDAMFERKVQTGEVVIHQGDDGDNFYVIQSGIYNIHVNTDQEHEKFVGKYDNTGSFGELALMYNQPRAATIKAATDGSLWAMNRQVFRKIVLKGAFKKRREYETLLEGVPLLQFLNPYERMNLCDALMPKSYKDDETIIKQGEVGDGMYFVESGTVRIVMVNESGEEKEVSKLNKGQYFGELALVTHKPRAASVYSVGDVKLAFLDVQAFERLLGPCMDIMKRNINEYEEQFLKVFGSKTNIGDLR
ncbi:cAMP-dependent protein kinase type II regulatory subunit-like isoform X1 [Limulus polyphemus]|uniref:cAMP-dependent protein kinase type II regulatory subunit-like isoform X1 n=1 Tax=Limulus polyphemus TaxID=6850 RepID=A0ABM1C5F1_LIMPO|nr:cAMP-dependent protein kinase type II regulatory subunit-like isoform X1 [Limulus polyphemus]